MYSLSWLNEAPAHCRSRACVRSLGARSCGAGRDASGGWDARRKAPFRSCLVVLFLAVAQGGAKCAPPVLCFCFSGQAFIPPPRRAGRAFTGKYQPMSSIMFHFFLKRFQSQLQHHAQATGSGARAVRFYGISRQIETYRHSRGKVSINSYHCFCTGQDQCF
jgi:hypothetical protein